MALEIEIKAYLHRDLMVGHLMLFQSANHLPIAMPLMATLLCLCYDQLYHLDLKNDICQWEVIFQRNLPKATTAKINCYQSLSFVQCILI